MFQLWNKSRWTKGGWAGAVLVTVVGLICLVPFIGGGLIHLSYDLSYFFRPDIPVEGVEIVYMDVESRTRLHQEDWQYWDRSLHARLIGQLAEAGAKAVVFDVVFVESTNRVAEDEALVEAAARFGKVVVGAKDESTMVQGHLASSKLTKPFPALEAVAAWGLFEQATADGYIREHHSLKLHDAPSLAWRAAQLTLTNALPDPYESRWINYYGRGMLSNHSYWEALESTRAEEASVFSNKVVFVGSRYPIGVPSGYEVDAVNTPHTRWTRTKTPGVDVVATAYLNFVRGDWLERTSVLAELALLAGCGLVIGWGFTVLPPMAAAGIGVACGTMAWAAAHMVVWTTGVWFPWLLVSAVQMPLGVAWSVLVHTRRLARENRALEASIALADARAEATEATARLTMKETIQAGAGPIEHVPASSAHSIHVPDYVLLRQIGEGAFGKVYLARDIIGGYHAVKIVHRHHFRQSDGPYEREFNGLKRYTPISSGHPGLVQVQHVGRNDQGQYIYYVMELADDEVSGASFNPETYEARNLAKDLKKRRSMPVIECVDICVQVASALEYLHLQHLIHRDIKPSNIIFVKGRPKLADIGLVTQTVGADHSVSFLGTHGYIPPEGPGSPLADIYSLGKVIYEAATGFPLSRYPELPTSLMEHQEGDLLLELNRVILTACDFDPLKRYASAAELIAALAAVRDACKRSSA